MEALIALAIFIVVGALTARFGHDSHDSLRLKEHHLAAFGVSWGKVSVTQPSVPADASAIMTGPHNQDRTDAPAGE